MKSITSAQRRASSAVASICLQVTPASTATKYSNPSAHADPLGSHRSSLTSLYDA
jgi:hypothetical protein